MQFKKIENLYKQIKKELEKHTNFNELSIITHILFANYFTELSSEECNERLKFFFDEDAKFDYQLTQYILKNQPHDAAGCEIQTKFLRFALDYGLDIATIITNEEGLNFNLEFLSRNQELLLHHPTNPSMNPDAFLKTVVESDADDNAQKIKHELIKHVIKLGANVNKEVYVGESILNIARELETINLLKSYGAECGTTSKSIDNFIQQHNLERYFENIDGLAQILTQKLLSPMQYINSIPYINASCLAYAFI